MKKQLLLPALLTASVLAVGVFIAPAVSAATLFQQVTNVAASDTLNMRASPSAAARVVGSIPHNGRTIVATGKKQGNWAEISWAGQVGWVRERFLEDSPGTGARATAHATTRATARAARTTTRVGTPARRTARTVAGVGHTHPANACTRSIQHSHGNGGNPHDHHYACQQNTMSMVKPKFKPKSPQIVMPSAKYQNYSNANAEINYTN